MEGGLLILLEVETDEDVIASHSGKAILDQIINSFQTSFKQNNLKLKDLLDEVASNPFIKNLILGLLEKNLLTAGCLGEASAVLVREGVIGQILTGQSISKGEVKEGDRIILHSADFGRNWEEGQLSEIYKFSNLADFEEILSPKLASHEKFTGNAVLAVEVIQQEEFSAPQDIVYSLKPKDFKLKLLASLWQTRKALIIILGLILLLTVNISASVLRMKQTSKTKEISQELATVKQQYEEAGGILDLNPVRARELLSSSKLTLGKLLKNSRRNSRDYKLISDWLSKVSESEVAAYRIYKFTDVPVFFDMTLIKADGEADNVSAYQEKKVILDNSHKTLYFLSTNSKESAVLAGSDNLKNSRGIAVHGSTAYFLNEDGIYAVDLGSKKAGKVIEKSERWGEIADIEAFGGNLYLLDTAKNNIWKYTAAESGFSPIVSYLNEGISVNLAKTKELAIDGSIWAAGSDSLFKFTAGNREQFAFQGISDSITSIDGISTSDENERIYILDKTLSRVLVFDKDGLYQSQYQWDSLAKAKDFIVTEKEGKIYVLIGNKIFAIEIK